jgi:hypothetical protein
MCLGWEINDQYARRTFDKRGLKGVLPTVSVMENHIPLLSKEGKARSAGVVCSKMRSHLIDVREAPLS